MFLQIGGIRITFLILIVCLVMCLGNLRCAVGERTNERRKRDLIKDTVDVIKSLKPPVMRWLRVCKAKKVLKKDAMLKVSNDLFSVYNKLGGMRRAEKDFMFLDAYDVKEGYSEELGGVWKSGLIGDHTLIFKQKFSDDFPYPGIAMRSPNTPDIPSGHGIFVFYRSLKD